MTDVVSIPPELLRKHSSIELCVDIIYVNKIGFLTTIGCPMYYRKTSHVKDGKKNTVFNALDHILRTWNSGGFHVTKIYCDNGFKAIMETVKDELKTDINYSNPQDHEPRIERNNRTIKNQTRVGLHGATFKRIPKIMITELVMGSTEKFNMFPAKAGVSDHYSPETIVSGETLNYKKHCSFEFGECVQAHNYTEPRNDMRERTLDAIHLRPTYSDQGGHRVMDLTTGELITRSELSRTHDRYGERES